jgi:hypothetical protein
MRRILTIMLMLVMVASLAAAASVTPVLYTNEDWQSGDAAFECGEVGCGDFSYKIEPWGMGMDGPYDNGNITISSSNNYTFNWTSVNPVCAVIVKNGVNGTYVYNYNGAYGDTELVAPGDKEISHVTFCYNGDDDNGGLEEIPEFPTVALPIAAILGLAFFFQRRKE